jgi:hypothetical protein
MKVIVYGASDDLIEIDGDLNDEVAYTGDEDEGILVAFSDGTVLRITYGANDEGFWRISRIVAGSAAYDHKPGEDEREDYSDRVTLEGDFKWAVCGNTLVRPWKGTK